MLKIALLGACPAQLSELAAAMNPAGKALDGQITLVTAGTADALPTGLSGFDLVLLSGLEARFLANCTTGPCPVANHETVDRSIRNALAQAAISYRVLYGTADERHAHAQQAVESLLPAASRSRQATRPVGLKNQPWVWMCDKCSDPQCEHRLLTALLASRDTSGEQALPY
ncbi:MULTISPECIES: hypothetical protein [unclassified Polaromonas]|uniref:hypothetical protein n=1 Tax=unclassified Polaromonas TaxID=2638319 RepID=UPI0018CB04E5|nr:MULTISPECIES: hypothetical protein [unclassified Polaromonas]MBG6071222.1 hypothetical protein [Polaromonas sp. CG_9.7]MBG6113222.1 hypothetical protein [Polaromonas sp. CG_9.2]MDH6185754.1 hypothetical protein [Polaromonas sp. CG_23.6]